jgi:hypothetical protein
MELANSKVETVRSRVLEVMGFTVLLCHSDAPPAACRAGLDGELLSIIRKHAATDPDVTPSAITTLGVCGTTADIPMLESLRTKFHDPNDINARGWLIDHAEAAIRSRGTHE